MAATRTSDASTNDSDSIRRCALVVACWCLTAGLLPPNGIVWQLGAFDALQQWLVIGVLASLDLTGLVS